MPTSLTIMPSILLVILSIFTSYQLAFLQDDAFISFRYAENFAQGMGLVWQPGDYVQGYTNPLWTMILSVSIFFGSSPEMSAIVLGLFFHVIVIWAFTQLCRRIFRDEITSLFLALVLALNYSFASYATGGLETSLTNLLIIIAISIFFQLVVCNDNSWKNYFFLSVMSSLIFLNRMDGLLTIGVFGCFVIFHIIRQFGPQKKSLQLLATLTIPFLISVITYLVWSYYYYGELVPNTALVKSSGFSLWRYQLGLNYLYQYFSAYGFLPYFLIGGLIAFTTRDIFAISLTTYVVLHCIYVVFVGGDFMEFRFLNHLTPLMLILFGGAFEHFTSRFRPLFRLLIAATLLLSFLSYSFLHGRFFQNIRGIESMSALAANVSEPTIGWDALGRRLAVLFPDSFYGAPVVAVEPAGAIPFYSKLNVIDMLGLNDKYIAKHVPANRFGRVGHQKMAPFAYLKAQRVNIVIGHPFVREIGTEEFKTLCPITFLRDPGSWAHEHSDLLASARVISMQINKDISVAMLYLFPHPDVERRIMEGEIGIERPDLRDCF